MLGASNQLANVLNELGVKRGDRVGIFLEPSLETAQSVYGIVKAGAAFVPLDPHSPPERIAFLLNDCGIKHLVSNSTQIAKLKKVLLENTPLETVVGIDEDIGLRTTTWGTVNQTDSERVLDLRILEQDLAYIMYTSGTTGSPKGIMHTHGSGLAYARLSSELYGIKRSDRLANHSPLHFDISTMGYLTMPFSGATTVVIPDKYKNFPASLSKLIEQEAITFWYSVPLALMHLLQRGVLESRNLESLRWVLFGGEPFPPKHLRELMKLWKQAKFSNVYGPAEVNQCTYYHIPELPALESEIPIPEVDSSIPIGKVWNNTEALILDEDDSKVADGEIGELLIRSSTMMKGYWNAPELNEASFYRSKAGPNYDETFYRTGDLVLRNENDDLVFMGRKDRQIKVRGYRVELDEIESVLIAHPNIVESAVYQKEYENGERVIEAAVILENSAEHTSDDLRTYIARFLPAYAVPSIFYLGGDIPRTSAGKIDYKKLIDRKKTFAEAAS